MWLINVLNEFDLVWCVKGLKLVVSWRHYKKPMFSVMFSKNVGVPVDINV